MSEEVRRRGTFIHGHGSPGKNSGTYKCWINMNRRCKDPKTPKYPDYGGRGIIVCERWRHCFPAFLADMGERPSVKHSLDRIDVNSNYEPGNCRWATNGEQQNNRRTTVRFTVNGVTRTRAEWSRITGINRATLKGRQMRGWTDEQIVLTPVEK